MIVAVTRSIVMATDVTMTADEILDEYQMNKLHELMPVIVIMSTVGVLGIVGNSFTIAFYGFVTKNTPTVFLITSLAVADLLVCIQIIPQVVDTAINVQFTNASASKLINFFAHWTITTSALILWFIAIDRYRHVCRPSKTQVSLKGVKWAVLVIISFCLIFSLSEFVIYDVIKFSIESQMNNVSVAVAHLYTTTEDSQYRVIVTVFHSIDAVSVVTILVTFCVTYGNIVWTLKKGGCAFGNNIKQRDYEESTKSKEITRNVEPTTRDPSTSDPSTNEMSSTEDLKGNDDRDLVNGSNTNSNCSKIKRPDKAITLMMLVVSLVFCICFVPYFVVKIGFRSYKSASQLELGVGIQLAIRFVFVNSVANPIVFCVFNPQFRRYIKNTLLRLKPGPGQGSTTTLSGSPSKVDLKPDH